MRFVVFRIFHKKNLSRSPDLFTVFVCFPGKELRFTKTHKHTEDGKRFCHGLCVFICVLWCFAFFKKKTCQGPPIFTFFVCFPRKELRFTKTHTNTLKTESDVVTVCVFSYACCGVSLIKKNLSRSPDLFTVFVFSWRGATLYKNNTNKLKTESDFVTGCVFSYAFCGVSHFSLKKKKKKRRTNLVKVPRFSRFFVFLGKELRFTKTHKQTEDGKRFCHGLCVFICVLWCFAFLEC